MEKLILFSLIFILKTSVVAQSYHPFPTDSARWIFNHFHYYNASNANSNNFQYSLTGDTIINGKQYALLEYKSPTYLLSPFGSPIAGDTLVIGGIREDSTKKIWFYNFGISTNPNDLIHLGIDSIIPVGEETILFDFSLQVGDSLRHPVSIIRSGYSLEGIDSAYSIVHSIDSILLLDGTYRKVFVIQQNFVDHNNILSQRDSLNNYTYWLEGVGAFYCDPPACGIPPFLSSAYWTGNSHHGLFGMLQMRLYDGFAMPQGEFNLDCFSHRNVTLYSFFNSNCELVTGLPNVLPTNELSIKVMPNPFQSSTKIEIDQNLALAYEQVKVEIFDIMGSSVRKVSSNSNEIIIKRGSLNNGVYLYIVTGNDEVLASGKLVVID